MTLRILVVAAMAVGASIVSSMTAPGSSWAAGEQARPWTPLFDGKTLKGWALKGGAAKYAVVDGTIVGTTVPNTKNTFLVTERHYGDFVLEFEFKVHPQLNSGVQLRGQSRPDYQDGRVHGYQVEIDPDVKRGRMWTGGLYDEGRRGWLADLAGNEPARKAFKPEAWNHVRVEAFGASLKTFLNGVPAAEITDAQDLEGFIGLQVHQVGKREDPLTVAWRKLRIQDHGRHTWRPLADGKTLRGFRSNEGAPVAADGSRTSVPPAAASPSPAPSATAAPSPTPTASPSPTGAPSPPPPVRWGAWSVEEGRIVGNRLASPRASLLFLEPPAAGPPPGLPVWAGGEYVLRAEVKITGGNGGIYVGAISADGPAGAAGLQVDLDATRGVSGFYDTGAGTWLARTGEPADDKAAARGPKSWKTGDWNMVTVIARPDQVTLFINGYRSAAAKIEGSNEQPTLALELAPGDAARLEVRRLEIMSENVPPPVPGFPIGWCIRANGTAPEEARTAGLEQLELALQDVVPLADADFDRLAERLKALGLPVLSGYNLFGSEWKLIGPEADRAKQDEHLDRALPRLARLGIKYLVFNSGPARKAPEGMDLREARKALVELGRRMARKARPHRIEVLLEPLRRTDTNQVNTVAEAIEVVRAVGQPNFRILIDHSFMAIEKEDPAVLKQARGLIRHVHIARPEGRSYPVAEDAPAYQGLFTALAAIGYKGGISIHARTDNFFNDAPRALSFLRAEVAKLPPTRKSPRPAASAMTN